MYFECALCIICTCYLITKLQNCQVYQLYSTDLLMFFLLLKLSQANTASQAANAAAASAGSQAPVNSGGSPGTGAGSVTGPNNAKVPSGLHFNRKHVSNGF